MNDLLRKFVAREVQGALLELHTAFLAKTLCLRENRADVQPLILTREAGGKTAALPVLTGVPWLRGAKPAEGEVCLCVVCEREPGAALRGEWSLPRPGHHSLADCVIVGVVEA